MRIRRQLLVLGGALLLVSGAGPAASTPLLRDGASAVPSTSIVISQFQVAGGAIPPASPAADEFVELHNVSTTDVSLNGWRVVYRSAAGTSDGAVTTFGAISIPAGGYRLLGAVASGGGGYDGAVPADTTFNVGSTGQFAGAGGGLALYDTTGATIDSVGYGTATNAFVETAPTTAPAANASKARLNQGCQDTDNNSTDFETINPSTPRNSMSSPAACGVVGDTAPGVSSTSPAGGASGVPVDNSITITFSEPVSAPEAAFSISCATSGAHAFALSGGPTTYTLNPTTDFVSSESCTVTVTAGQVSDQDTDDPPDVMVGDHVFTFVTATPEIEIHQVQGASHISPRVGDAVTLAPGIVTAVRTNGFFLQDPTPDAVDATSDAIFVFTSTAPTAAVGDAVRVSGNVVEFRAGGGASANLTLTEITSPTVALVSEMNGLPAATVIGGGGRTQPTSVINDDGTGDVETSGTFDPATDGIDFYESLEAVRVQVNDGVVSDPTNGFGELWVLPDNGAAASQRTARGGIVVRAGDFNPERVQLDDVFVPTPAVNVGDTIPGAAIGVLNYDFGNFELLLTSPVTAASGGLAREETTPAGPLELSVATFNVENLDPTDPPTKFADLANLIVNNLKSPDVIGLEEVQDNNGATNDSTTDASLTLSVLASAITAAGGPSYQFRQIDPVDDQDGGEPGGNIRVAFLFRTDRGVQFVDRPGGGSTTDTGVVNGPSGAELTASPGRVNPTNTAWNASRKPLAGEFLFRGEKYFVIVNHFNSKGGDQPLFGRFQPPTLSSEVQRLQQAQLLNNFVDSILAVDANANVIALGDFNDFEFSPPLQTLMGGVMFDLIETLPANERYGYVFEGNSQTLDHILVSTGVIAKILRPYDVVHVNAEFAAQTSDHDPSILRIGDEAELSLTKTASHDTIVRNGILTYTLRVTNGGPQPATNVTLTDPLPAGAELVSVASSQGTCGGGATVTCSLGVLADGATATVVIEARMTQVGMRTNTAVVDAAQDERNGQDNQASVTTNVIAASYPLTVTRAGTGTGTVTSSPAGINCGTDCSEDYLEGTEVTLTATPASGSTFTGWSGACTGTAGCTVTMSQARSVTATFTRITHVLTVSVTGTGAGTVTSSPPGINCLPDCTETYDEGTVVALTATPASGSTFAGWSGHCTGTGACSVTMNQARSVIATFTRNTHVLTVTRAGTGTGTVTSAPAGINCGTDCTETYDEGTVVTLTATPASGSTFTGWSGACTGTAGCTVTMSQARSVTATFTRNTHVLAVTRAGDGTGTVTSSPAGINCGTDCTETYDEGTVVNLTGAAASGSSFTGWSGACTGSGVCTVTMSQARSVTATFTRNRHVLTVTRAGDGTGTVSSSPAGINCGTDCTETYEEGAMVTLTPAPGNRSSFGGWSGACTGTGSCTVTMSQARSVTATFTLRDCRVTATPGTIVADRRTTVTVTAMLLGPKERQRNVLVRLRGAGVEKSARTGKSGTARISVRPERAGTIKVTAPELGKCSDSVRVVRPRRSGTAGAGTGGGAGLAGRAL